MPQAHTVYEHVTICEDGVARIAGTTMKVKELVAEKLAYGWSPEELKLNHSYLTLGQIYAALAYYADHAEAIEKQIDADLRATDQLRESAGPSPMAARVLSQRRD